jgi:CRP/FNR family transcriptional regulator, cyclic AMP receptor protein
MRHKLDKETAALADEIADLEVLRGLSRASAEALAAIGRVVHVPASWALVSESQPADSCYLLLDGEVEVRVQGDPVATLEHGAVFGEAALVEHRTRNASVITKTDVRAVRLAFDDLVPVLGAHPEIEQAFKAAWDKRSG